MNEVATSPQLWLLRRYLALSLPLHLIWETLQLPLYTLWRTGTAWQKCFAVIHCTAGDLIIAALSLGAALLSERLLPWPRERLGRIALLAVGFGVAYTIYSEWVNTTRGAWAYEPFMPVVPPLGTGLFPLLQWLIVPLVALSAALRRYR